MKTGLLRLLKSLRSELRATLAPFQIHMDIAFLHNFSIDTFTVKVRIVA
jgi:hypothetical protein